MHMHPDPTPGLESWEAESRGSDFLEKAEERSKGT